MPGSRWRAPPNDGRRRFRRPASCSYGCSGRHLSEYKQENCSQGKHGQHAQGHHRRCRQGRDHVAYPDRYRWRGHRDSLDHQRSGGRTQTGKRQGRHRRDQGQRRDGGRRLIDRRALIAGLSAALIAPRAASAETVTDAAGRTVPVPAKVSRVYPAGPPAAILLYTLAPEMLIGWPRANRPEECAYMLPEICTRPEVGRITGRGNTANLETVLALKPDLILDVGSTSATFVSLADRVQEQTNIPYALRCGRCAGIANSYRSLGALIGRAEDAEKLARYTEDTLKTITCQIEPISVSERPKVYYAGGPRGLATGPGGPLTIA